jgi:energy-coupling factor transport system ATP-binding protein
MIHFQKFAFTYPDAASPTLSGVDVHIPDGSFTLVIGPSGAGKSTLLRALNGLVPHFTGGAVAGSVRVDGRDPIVTEPQRMSTHVGFVAQDPDAQFVTDRVEDEIAFTLENAALPPAQIRLRLEETLDILELAHLRRRRIDTLSGGQKQRTAIASALALRPRVLALDEPTSQLDPKSAEDVLHALLRLNHDLGLTIMLSEHRLDRVAPFADRVVHLPARGEPPIVGDSREILSHYDAAPAVVRLAHRFGWQPTPLSVKEGRPFAARERIEPRAVTALGPRTATPLIQIKRLDAGYDGTPVLHDVNFALDAGQSAAILGRNGSGKSTLLKSIIGLVRPTRGSIHVAGQDVTHETVASIAARVAYVPQDPNTLLFADTVADELRITLRNHRMAVTDERIAATLAQFDLADVARRYPRDLSSGERQRVALAALCVTQPQALLLDEPTRGLDHASRTRLIAYLRRMRDDGAGILLVTHDVELAAALADRVVLLGDGRILLDGAPTDLLANSPLFATQTARLFPGSGHLTPDTIA